MFQDFTLFTQNTVAAGREVREVWMKTLSFWTIAEVIGAGRKTCAPLSHTDPGEIWKNKRCGAWQHACDVHAKKNPFGDLSELVYIVKTHLDSVDI